MLGLAQAVGSATQYGRDYQSQKEALYRSALDLTLTRYRDAPQWFGTIDAVCNRRDGQGDVSVNAKTGVNQGFLLGDAERKLVLAAKGLGVQLDLTASANVASTPDTQLTKLRFHEGAYSLGLAAKLGFFRDVSVLQVRPDGMGEQKTLCTPRWTVTNRASRST